MPGDQCHSALEQHRMVGEPQTYWSFTVPYLIVLWCGLPIRIFEIFQHCSNVWLGLRTAVAEQCGQLDNMTDRSEGRQTIRLELMYRCALSFDIVSY